MSPMYMEEMCFPQTDSAVDEERIVGARGQLGHRLASGLGELIGVADHEGIEGVADGEAGGGDGRLGLGRRRGGQARFAVDVERDAGIAAEDFPRRRLQRLGVMLMKPISCVRIGRRDLDVIALDGGKTTGTEPRVQGGRWHFGSQGDEHSTPQSVEHR